MAGQISSYGVTDEHELTLIFAERLCCEQTLHAANTAKGFNALTVQLPPTGG
jgi:hypothetical protein